MMKVATDYLCCPSLRVHSEDTEAGKGSQLAQPTKQLLVLVFHKLKVHCFAPVAPFLLLTPRSSFLPGIFTVFPFCLGIQFVPLSLAMS